jgi:4-amino-4-deoxy-L-arabinose transferase-like glycosyltransferase
MGNHKTHIILYAFVCALFLLITGPILFSDGMFMDGLIHATIANNMADGMGSFWDPHLTSTLLPHYFEHPPLVFGLQSLWFSAFGDSIFVERFYSLTMCVITGWLIVLIWKQLGNSLKTGWIPLFFWVTVSNVSWCCANNMLENTMTVFVVLAALFYLKSQDKRTFKYLILCGVALFLAFMSKGFVSLYIWSMPFFAWLLFRKENFLQMCIHTVIVVGATVLPLLLLLMLSPSAAHYLTSYFNNQVMGSIQNVATVDSRFAIFWEFLQHILLPLGVAILIISFAAIKKIPLKITKERKTILLFFALIIFSGIFPIIISLKQRGFYILTVYPFFAIALSTYLFPLLQLIKNQIVMPKAGRIAFTSLTLVMVVASIVISVISSGRVGRDNELIEDVHTVANLSGSNTTISISPAIREDWSVSSYFMRYHKISLDTGTSPHAYFLTNPMDTIDTQSYKEIPLILNKYRLYRLSQ